MNIVASLFNLSGPDLFIILLVALLFFGAKRLPELARGLGQAMNEFSKAKDEMQRQITSAGEPTVVRPRELQEHRPQDNPGNPAEAGQPAQAETAAQAPAAGESAPIASADKPATQEEKPQA